MGFVIGLLTIVMVLDCLILVALVLIQLPKKDTGGGLAFGGGASDALFGAGSGNVLTKVTKYSATVFFILAVALSMMQKNYHNRSSSEFGRKLSEPGGLSAPAPAPTAPAPAPTTTPQTPSTSTNLLLNIPVPAAATNNPSPEATPSNAVPGAPK
jgi:preprotein translocase subunit SecG